MGFPWIALAMGASSLVDAALSDKSYPPWLEDLLKSMTMQGKALADRPGISDTDVAALFGKGYENIRGQGKNVREATTSTLANMGMSETGTAVKAAQQNAWSNENLVTNAIRDMVIAKKQAKTQDLALATQIAGAATGAEVNRIDKGPDLTSLVGMLGLMGVGTGENKSKSDDPEESQDNVDPVADSFAILSKAGRSQTPLKVIPLIQDWLNQDSPFSFLADYFKDSLSKSRLSKSGPSLW